ncbi:insulinase family protein [bacterium]|nr:insulinase family protein [bacterium]
MENCRAPLLLAAALAALLILSGCVRNTQPITASPIAPVTGQTIDYQVGEINVHRFPNRLTMIHRQNQTNQIVAVTCLIRPGAAQDPDDKIGQSRLMMRTLTKGTKNRTSDEIAEELEDLGASLNTSDTYDYVAVSLKCVRSDLDKTLDIFADVIRHPTFPQEELDAEKTRQLAEIRIREDRSPSAVMTRFRGQLFGAYPYGRPLEGQPEIVSALTQRDVGTLHEQVVRPENMVISLVGDVDEEEARMLIDKYFGDMADSGSQRVDARKSFAPSGSRFEFVRDVEQGFVALGHVTCPIDDEDAPTVEVASAVLGRGMSSRLFSELRDRQSLAYMVGASANEMYTAGYFVSYIATSPQTVDKALNGLWEQIELLRYEPVTDEELDRARTYLIGGYLRGHETNSQQAYHLANWQLAGMGVAYDEIYPDRIRAVTSRDVMRVANKYFLDPTVVILRPMGKKSPASE